MMPRKVSEIRKDHQMAGALNALINVCSFIDEHTFLTKSGDLGAVFKVQGIDYECLDHSEINAFARRFEAALRSLSEEFRLYQYLLKRGRPAGLLRLSRYWYRRNSSVRLRSAASKRRAKALISEWSRHS